MRRVVRSLPACVVAALALALAACGGEDETDEPVGTRTLTIYSSLPLHGPSRRQALDMVNAYKLALKDAGGQVGPLTVNYVSLDASEPDDRKWTEDKVLDNARQVVRDPNAIAYLGELDSAATALSLPLLNEAGILQISPTSTYLGLTRSGTGRKGEPERFYPARRRTFGRVVPADHRQAQALARYMRAEGVRRLAVLDDRELYGSGLAEQVDRIAGRHGIEIVHDEGMDPDEDDLSDEAEDVAESGADAFLFGGSTDTGAARVFNAVGAAAPRMLLFGGDGVAESAFVADLEPSVRRRMRITSPALPPRMLPERARTVRAALQSRFGRRPEPYALHAYEAMSVALEAVRRAGPQGNRRPAVVAAFLTIDHRRSVLGTYSIDRRGDTSLSAFAGRRVRGSRLIFDEPLGAG